MGLYESLPRVSGFVAQPAIVPIRASRPPVACPRIPCCETPVLGLPDFLKDKVAGRRSRTEPWRRSCDLPRSLFRAGLREKSIEPPVALESYVGAIRIRCCRSAS